MKKAILPILFVFTFVCFVVVMLSLLGDVSPGSIAADMKISTVLYGGGSTDRWKSLEMGIRQACRDLEIEMPAVSVPSGEDPQAQLRLIEREMSGGAKGLLIAPEGGEEMAIALEALTFSTPVVFMMNEVEGFAHVAADDAAMGRLLAGRLLEEDWPVALVQSDWDRGNSRGRREAFLAEMEAAGKPVIQLGAPGDLDASAMLAAIGEAKALVALDTETLECLIDMLSEVEASISLYGIGSSDKIVSAMSQGIVEGIVFQNEYAVGYIATMQLAARLGLTKTAPQAPIAYMYADKESMFDTDIAGLLFTVVQ